MKPDGTVKNGRVFFNASSLAQGDPVGSNPDGFKVDSKGNVIASGPGGVLVISADGRLLGRMKIDRPVSNVAFGDGFLYITASDTLMRLKLA